MISLECIDLTKSFDGIVAVDDVDVTFEAGKITALIGPNGAGKTTLFHLITGFLKPDHGAITFHGEPIQGLKPWDVAQRGIGRLFQDVRVFDKMPVIDNILSAFRNQKGENPLYSLVMRKKVHAQEREIVKKSNEILEFVGLEAHRNKQAEDLSYGQQKLLAIARLLANDSDVLLLDEPASGVHPDMVKKLLDLIRKLAYEQNKTIIIIEHNMTVVLDISDWVFFMDDGRIVSFGLPKEVLDDPEVRAAYMGV